MTKIPTAELIAKLHPIALMMECDGPNVCSVVIKDAATCIADLVAENTRLRDKILVDHVLACSTVDGLKAENAKLRKALDDLTSDVALEIAFIALCEHLNVQQCDIPLFDRGECVDELRISITAARAHVMKDIKS